MTLSTPGLVSLRIKQLFKRLSMFNKNHHFYNGLENASGQSRIQLYFYTLYPQCYSLHSKQANPSPWCWHLDCYPLDISKDGMLHFKYQNNINHFQDIPKTRRKLGIYFELRKYIWKVIVMHVLIQCFISKHLIKKLVQSIIVDQASGEIVQMIFI